MASLKVGSKFTVFALFYFVLEGNFPSTSSWRVFIRRGDLTESFLHYRIGGFILIWRGLYMEGLIFGILLYVSGKGDVMKWWTYEFHVFEPQNEEINVTRKNLAVKVTAHAVVKRKPEKSRFAKVYGVARIFLAHFFIAWFKYYKIHPHYFFPFPLELWKPFHSEFLWW